jgi:hypothetical protein
LSHTVAMTDHYTDGTYRWWHLSRPSPELLATLGDGWLRPGGRALDIGCGLGVETVRGTPRNSAASCGPGGRLLLRASLNAAGVRNDIDETVIGRTFAAWQIEHMQRTAVPSDTRTLEVILARLSTTSPP